MKKPRATRGFQTLWGYRKGEIDGIATPLSRNRSPLPPPQKYVIFLTKRNFL